MNTDFGKYVCKEIFKELRSHKHKLSKKLRWYFCIFAHSLNEATVRLGNTQGTLLFQNVSVFTYIVNVCSNIEGNASFGSTSEAWSLINYSFTHVWSWVKVPTSRKVRQESLLAPCSAAGASCPGSWIIQDLSLLLRWGREICVQSKKAIREACELSYLHEIP